MNRVIGGRLLLPAAAAALVLVGVVAGIEVLESGNDLDERRARVAAAGVAVMPFDLERTTHTFTDTAGLAILPPRTRWVRLEAGARRLPRRGGRQG